MKRAFDHCARLNPARTAARRATAAVRHECEGPCPGTWVRGAPSAIPTCYLRECGSAVALLATLSALTAALLLIGQVLVHVHIRVHLLVVHAGRLVLLAPAS